MRSQLLFPLNDTLTHTVNVMVLFLIKGFTDSKGSLERSQQTKAEKTLEMKISAYCLIYCAALICTDNSNQLKK